MCIRDSDDVLSLIENVSNFPGIAISYAISLFYFTQILSFSRMSLVSIVFTSPSRKILVYNNTGIKLQTCTGLVVFPKCLLLPHKYVEIYSVCWPSLMENIGQLNFPHETASLATKRFQDT